MRADQHIENSLLTRDKIIAYLQNKLSTDERNRFEQALHADPFLADAVEGFKMMPARDIHTFVDTICRDLDLLTAKSGKRRAVLSMQTRPMAIAALFLIFIGVSWFAVWFMNYSANKQQIAKTEKISDVPDVSTPSETFVPADKNITEGEQVAADKTTEIKTEQKKLETETLQGVKRSNTKEENTLAKDAVIADERKAEDAGLTEDLNTKTTDAASEPALARDADIQPRIVIVPPASADMDKKQDKQLSEMIVTESTVQKNSASGNTSKSKDENQDGYGSFDDVAIGSSAEEETYTFVQVMPQYPGGQAAMLDFLQQNLHLPATDMLADKAYTGEVTAKFTVDKTGRVRDAQILKGEDASLNAEIIKVLYSMPLWTPGQQNGEDVNVSLTLPLRLEPNK